MRLSASGAKVKRGLAHRWDEESDRLPYWAQRHNHIVYRSGGQEARFEVRTMIAWDERWYITHLSEAHSFVNALAILTLMAQFPQFEGVSSPACSAAWRAAP
jgi:hypothetical protein